MTKGIKKGSRVADLCAGNGIIPLLLSARVRGLSMTAVEFDSETCALAEHNMAFNGLADDVHVLCGDVRELSLPCEYDAVTVNPPYIPVGSGRVSADEAVSAARHETHATIDDIARAAARLLKDKGKVFMVHRAHRTAELLSCLRMHRLEPKLLQFVHARSDEKANLVLVAAAKNTGQWTDVLPPLILYNQDGTYTQEVNEIYGRKTL